MFHFFNQVKFMFAFIVYSMFNNNFLFYQILLQREYIGLFLPCHRATKSCQRIFRRSIELFRKDAKYCDFFEVGAWSYWLGCYHCLNIYGKMKKMISSLTMTHIYRLFLRVSLKNGAIYYHQGATRAAVGEGSAL